MMSPRDHDVDTRFCREILPRVSRTFAINIRLLDHTLGDAVRTGYLLCRAADALEDSWPGPPEAVRARFTGFVAALEGDDAAATDLAAGAAAMAAGRDDLELLASLPRVLRVYAALPAAHRDAVRRGVTTLAAGMSRYASRAAGRGDRVPYLDDEAELHDYCYVVAGCVGEMLTRLLAAEYGLPDDDLQTRRMRLAPVVGEALQLTNILLDWPADVRRGRCYLPATWLAADGLAPGDLIGAPHRALPGLVTRLEELARAALAQVPDYVTLVPRRHWRYRLFCLWPALWALGSLRRARAEHEFPWGPARPRLTRGELTRDALLSFLAVRDDGRLRDQIARRVRMAPAG
jgi:farnesyl-diphosphate farnesyltransferase